MRSPLTLLVGLIIAVYSLYSQHSLLQLIMSETLRFQDLGVIMEHLGTNAPKEYINHVVLSTTLNTFARKEDYDYLIPLVARNWLLFGFRPIILVVATSHEMNHSLLSRISS